MSKNTEPVSSAKWHELHRRLSAAWQPLADGGARIDRSIFQDPEIFECELEHFFESNWVFVAHESQVATPFSFVTTHMGRQPVIITRDKEGSLHCMINACTHRGAVLAREKVGVRRNFACGFHGWVFSSGGDLVGVTAEEKGAYPPSFEKKNLGLKQVRIESYRGFIFASLNADVVPLKDFLGPAAGMIDLVVDQSLEGQWEVLRGTTSYTYNGNWKLAAENGVDGYHASTVHASYVDVTMRRMAGKQSEDRAVMDLSKVNDLPGGYEYLGNGHAMVWTQALNEKVRPSYRHREEFVARYGEEKTSWMLGRLRNLVLAPNVYLMDSMSTQIRIIRPLCVDRTEVTTYCLAPVNEDAVSRRSRIRQYEDFYNASGLATPDDLTEFNACQTGFSARSTPWSDLSRGGARRGGSQTFTDSPSHGESDQGDEGIYVGIYAHWHTAMLTAVKQKLEVSNEY